MDLDPEKLNKLRRLIGKTSYEINALKLHNEMNIKKHLKIFTKERVKSKKEKRISLQIVDTLPDQSTMQSMEKSVIHNYERHSILRTVLHLTSHTFDGDYFEKTLHKRKLFRRLGSRLKTSSDDDGDGAYEEEEGEELMVLADDSHSDSTDEQYRRKKTLSTRITCQWDTKAYDKEDTKAYYHQYRHPCIFPLPLDLADYRPLNAPFVPDLIFCLVNLIELNCYKESWKYMFQALHEHDSKAKEYVVKLIQIGNSKRKLKEAIQHLPTPVMIATLRAFLREFRIKPLHLTDHIVKDLVKQPLYDQFSRPNKQLRLIIRKSSLCSTRTQVDTLAFLMTHILHACEYAQNQIQGKIILCNIYGPLLISFSHKPDFVRGNFMDDYLLSNSSNMSSYQHTTTTSSLTTEIDLFDKISNVGKSAYYHQSVESAILQVILDVCDLYFWNYIGLFKIQSLFMNKTNLERFRQTLLDPYSKLTQRSVRVSRRNKSMFLAPTMIDFEKEIHAPSITSIVDYSVFTNELRKSRKVNRLSGSPKQRGSSFFTDRKGSALDEIYLADYCSRPFKQSATATKITK
ncbi:unnamed protein product [Trichobilharzia szidati]|nr:unnamed protein product [Trichobilharzia szidati]